jgi:hypothetical protein
LNVTDSKPWQAVCNCIKRNECSYGRIVRSKKEDDSGTCSVRGGRCKCEVQRPLKRSVRRESSRKGVATWWFARGWSTAVQEVLVGGDRHERNVAWRRGLECHFGLCK